MSVFSNMFENLNLFVLFYCTFMCGTSTIDSNPHYQNTGQSESVRRRRKLAHSVAIACRSCGRVFFDNYSLVVHFDEAHSIDEIPAPIQDFRTLARHEGFQTTYNYSGPRSFPVLPRNGGQIPMNSMPPLGVANYPLGLTTTLPLPLTEANNENPQIKPLGKRPREIIVISDDEEDELDLTLKL